MSAKKFCAALLLGLLAASNTAAKTREGYVLHVEDGNTITIAYAPKSTQPDAVLRLYGMEAPTPRQPLGPEARARLAALLPAGSRVSFVPVGESEDGPLAAIVQAGGTSVNYQLVMEGLAWVDRQTCRAVFCRRWYIQEHRAVLERRGIWGLDIGTPPWQWSR